jgi:TPR repeat protein
VRRAWTSLLLCAFACGVLLLQSCASAAGVAPEPGDDADIARGFAAYEARDFDAALAAFRRAAERNSVVGQFNLAVLLIAGAGGRADPV